MRRRAAVYLNLMGKSTQDKYSKAMRLCNSRKLEAAAPLMKEVINEAPDYSEAYRALAQIHLSLGDKQNTMDVCIDAKQIAMEIAMKGVRGINPDDKSGYSIDPFPGRKFSGYQFLAYYVSWILFSP